MRECWSALAEVTNFCCDNSTTVLVLQSDDIVKTRLFSFAYQLDASKALKAVKCRILGLSNNEKRQVKPGQQGRVSNNIKQAFVSILLSICNQSPFIFQAK